MTKTRPQTRSLLKRLGTSLLTCSLTACSPSPPDVLLPDVEPNLPATPDLEAISRRTSTNSINELIDWPQLFGPDRTSSATEHEVKAFWGVEGPRQIWSIDVGTGYGSPVVSNRKVYFNHRIEDEEIVQCVDADTGTAIWDLRYATDFVCDFEYSDGPIGTIMVAGERVYAVGGQGQFFCLNAEDGKPIWERNFQEEYQLEDDLFASGSVPLLIEDSLILNVGAAEEEAGILAMNSETGETLWTATDHGRSYCSPFNAKIHNQDFVFVVTSRGLVSLDPSNGKVDWEFEHFSRAPMSFNSVSPLVYQDHVLMVTGPGPGAICVKVLPNREYQIAWKDRRVLDSQYNTLMLAAGQVYGFTAAGQGGAELRCIDFLSGKLQWSYRSILRRGQGVVIGDTIVAIGERGHLAAVSRTEFSTEGEPVVLAFTEAPLMSEPCYCTPAFDGRRLYLKDEQRLACFALDDTSHNND